jgi:hypothetical protein
MATDAVADPENMATDAVALQNIYDFVIYPPESRSSPAAHTVPALSTTGTA